MGYELTKSDGTTLVSVPDGAVDSTSASLRFVGRDVVNFGEIQNENFLHLLENFSKNTAPSAPITGQLWFNASSSTLRLNVYDSIGWKQLPTITYNSTASNLTIGDFWLNTANNQLYLKNSTGYLLIGPNSSATTAVQLATPVQINSVPFNGTASITISATTTNSLLPGSYISGSAFNGSSSTTWAVDVGTVSSSTPFKVVARNSDGDIWYNVGHGVSSSSKYADLAEKYLPETTYEVGTVVTVGGPSEITACKIGDIAIGVISGKPGYMMNSDLKNGVYVALKGRVPVNITGAVYKGSKLVAGPNGTAIVGNTDYFGISLEDSNGKSVVEAVIL
jgi:hypothetical protein